MKRKLKILLGVAIFGCLQSAVYASLAESGNAADLSGEGGYGSAIIDPENNVAYFASSSTFVFGVSSFSVITPVTLSPFGINSGTAYYPQVTNFSAAAFDDGTKFGYFVSSQAPSAVEEIPLHGGVTVSSLTFAAGQNWIGTAVIDSANHFAYFGTQTSPSIVIKVSLPDGVSVTSMTIASSITLPSGLDYLTASVIDAQNGFAYFGSSTAPGAVAKIQLSNFTLASTLPFNSGEGGVASAVIDVNRQLAYFGTHDSPGRVVKIGLTDFRRIASVALSPGENDLTSAVLDPASGNAFFGTNTSPGIVIRLDSGLTQTAVLPLGSGENFLTSAVIDAANGYAYFGTYTTPGNVVQVDIFAGPPDILLQPDDGIVHPGETASFTVTGAGRNLTYQWQRDGVDIPGATAAVYSFTTALADDGATFRCVVTDANGSATSRSAMLSLLPVIRAYPNPWRSDLHTGAPITFDGLLANSTVKIFNLAAHWVKTLPLASGSTTWDRTNDAGQTVASGYYFYLITTGNDKQTVHGKLAIIR